MIICHRNILKYLEGVLIQIDLFIFFIVLFTLPFGKGIFTPVLFSWLCFVVFSYFIKRDYCFVRYKGLLILPIIFYILFFVSVILTETFDSGLIDLQMKILFFLFPLLFPYQRESYRANRRRFFWTFIAGCTVASLYYFSFAIYRSFSLVNGLWVFNPIKNTSWSNYFLNAEFSYLIHPSYLALYQLVGLLIIIVEFNRWSKKSFAVKFLIAFTLIVLVTSLILLQSRAGILSFSLLSFVCFFYFIIVKKKYFLSVGVGFALICITCFVFPKFSRLVDTAKSLETTAELGITNKSKEDGTAIRFWIWKSALSAIKEHPIWGIGTGNIRDELQKQYLKFGMKNAADIRLNAHNQYLETWLGMGIFGLIALLTMLFIPLWIGIKKHDWLLVGFICLCSVSFMFESMLERIAGIVFFVIFYTILTSVKTNLTRFIHT